MVQLFLVNLILTLSFIQEVIYTLFGYTHKPFSVDILPQDVIRNGVENVLNDLDTFLKRSYKGNYVKDDATPFALQFTLYGILEVDLLPSPFWSSSHEFVTFMERISPRDRRKFQCSEAKWQKEFLQRQPNEVRQYI
jgi:hypothetical protein